MSRELAGSSDWLDRTQDGARVSPVQSSGQSRSPQGQGCFAVTCTPRPSLCARSPSMVGPPSCALGVRCAVQVQEEGSEVGEACGEEKAKDEGGVAESNHQVLLSIPDILPSLVRILKVSITAGEGSGRS